MIDKEFAARFAADWIDSWNEHNLDRILSHYADDFEMSSPRIRVVAAEPSGILKGKEANRVYWTQALELAPNLRFNLVAALIGVNSIALCYTGGRGFSVEVFHFNSKGKVAKAYAHYL